MLQIFLFYVLYGLVCSFLCMYVVVVVLVIFVFILGVVVLVQVVSIYVVIKYLIVLVYGLLGISKFFGVVDYWYQIFEDLCVNGVNVYVVDVFVFNDEIVCGEQFVSQICSVFVIMGVVKVNFIGYSQGGLILCYVVVVVLDFVVFVIIIGMFYKGLEFVDFVELILVLFQVFVNFGVDVFGLVFGWFNGNSNLQNGFVVLYILLMLGVVDFNKVFFSVGLVSGCNIGSVIDVCNGNVQKLYLWMGCFIVINFFDLFDLVLVFSGGVMQVWGLGINDGLVFVCSVKFGQVLLMDYVWNYLDEVNQLFGLIGWGVVDLVVVICM